MLISRSSGQRSKIKITLEKAWILHRTSYHLHGFQRNITHWYPGWPQPVCSFSGRQVKGKLSRSLWKIFEQKNWILHSISLRVSQHVCSFQVIQSIGQGHFWKETNQRLDSCTSHCLHGFQWNITHWFSEGRRGRPTCVQIFRSSGQRSHSLWIKNNQKLEHYTELPTASWISVKHYTVIPWGNPTVNGCILHRAVLLLVVFNM